VLLGGVSIFGGRGHLLGVIVAVFLLGVLRNALTLNNVSSDALTIVTGGLLLLSVLGPSVTARVREALRRGRSPITTPSPSL
jgi:rhamnose transport system permease protein